MLIVSILFSCCLICKVFPALTVFILVSFPGCLKKSSFGLMIFRDKCIAVIRSCVTFKLLWTGTIRRIIIYCTPLLCAKYSIAAWIHYFKIDIKAQNLISADTNKTCDCRVSHLTFCAHGSWNHVGKKWCMLAWKIVQVTDQRVVPSSESTEQHPLPLAVKRRINHNKQVCIHLKMYWWAAH